ERRDSFRKPLSQAVGLAAPPRGLGSGFFRVWSHTSPDNDSRHNSQRVSATRSDLGRHHVKCGVLDGPEAGIFGVPIDTVRQASSEPVRKHGGSADWTQGRGQDSISRRWAMSLAGLFLFTLAWRCLYVHRLLATPLYDYLEADAKVYWSWA